MKYVIAGDTHGGWPKLNKFINKYKPDYLFICGDFGYWSKYSLKDIKTKNTKIYWLPGNHEHYDYLEKEYRRNGPVPLEIEKNIFYCPIGSTMNINDITILFVGGADSYDKEYRIKGESWFPQEILSNKDLKYIESRNLENIDIILSHTCPHYFEMLSKESLYGTSWLKKQDPTKDILNKLWQMFKPSYWFFGHYHIYKQGRYKNTYWTCLNHLWPTPTNGRAWLDVTNLF